MKPLDYKPRFYTVQALVHNPHPHTGQLPVPYPLWCFTFTLQMFNLIEAQKQSSKRVLDRFLEMSKSYDDAVQRLEEQERSHKAFIHKSNCLTALLEEDRERWVHQTLKFHMNTYTKTLILYSSC